MGIMFHQSEGFAWIMFLLPYRLAASKLLFTKSLKGLMCSSLVNKTWLAMLCRI